MYDIENYFNAETIKEAVTLLKEHPDARVISGGSDVLIKIREGKMAGTSFVILRKSRESSRWSLVIFILVQELLFPM